MDRVRDREPDHRTHGPGADRSRVHAESVAGYATVTAAGIEIERAAPHGVTFAPLPEEHKKLYSLFHDARASGAPVLRPLVYEFQSDPAVRTMGD